MTRTPHVLTRRRGGAAAAAVALALAGCGGGSTSTEQRTPQAALVAAVGQTQEVSSYRFEITSTTTAGGQVIEVSGGGVTRSDGSAGEMTFTLPGGQGELRQRLVDGVIYIELPQQPGVFHKLQLSDLVDTTLAGSVDPTSGLEALRGTGKDVKEVGREEVRGEQTTHYRGTIDVTKALDAVKGPLREMLQQLVARGEMDAVPFDAWIDDEGRIRQFDQALSFEVPQVPGGPVEVTTRLEVHDFGVDVDVEAPPADAVRDGTPLLDAFKGAGGGGTTGGTG